MSNEVELGFIFLFPPGSFLGEKSWSFALAHFRPRCTSCGRPLHQLERGKRRKDITKKLEFLNHRDPIRSDRRKVAPGSQDCLRTSCASTKANITNMVATLHPRG